MLYQNFKGLQLSALGFGAMRLPTGGDRFSTPVNEPEAARIVTCAVEHGVNYFDTAYSYHRGDSERIIGRILKQFPRNRFYLATKFPGHEIRPTWNARAIFDEQLAKCGVDYFDFYLLHNVYESSIKTYLNPQWGIIDYLLEQKKRGRIRHLGLSSHGQLETLTGFLNLYGDQMEFCQIELNYLDWSLQDAKSRYDMLSERGIPVWVMEPVKGGKLARLSSENEARLKAARPDESIAAWAFRWVQGLSNVKMVLSGMSTMPQVEDNLKTFSAKKPLTKDEIKLLEEIAGSMTELLPCTACRYCVTGCPQKLDIPTLLAYYNECRFSPSVVVRDALDAMEPQQRPSACIGCGNCKETCPQKIDVPEALKAFQAILDKLPQRGRDTEKMRAKLIEEEQPLI
jgi:uncharacterized protein